MSPLCDFVGCFNPVKAGKYCSGHLNQGYRGQELRPLSHSRRPRKPVEHTGREGVTVFPLRMRGGPHGEPQVLNEHMDFWAMGEDTFYSKASREWFVIDHETGDLYACESEEEAYARRDAIQAFR